MRTDNRSSRYAARLGVVITTLLLLAGCGDGQDEPSGAAPPPRAGFSDSPGSGAGAGSGSGSSGSGGTSGVGGAAGVGSADDTPAAAVRTVESYFCEINEASRSGRVANVAATALGGCQPCALDVGVTRSLQQRGLHTDGPPYHVTNVTSQPRVGLVTEVHLTVETRTVGLLDLAGRRVSDAPGVPTRTATAELALTTGGWRVQTLRYSAGPA